MFDLCSAGRAGRLSRVALVAAAAAIASSAASAGECPADKTQAGVRAAVSFAAKGVTDTVLKTIDLAKEQVKLNDHLQRVRRLVIEPGGIVPWHSHDDRPALIYIVEGEILEYASNCAVPIVHKAGEVKAETQGISHWWKNESNKSAVLLSFDILHDQKDHNM